MFGRGVSSASTVFPVDGVGTFGETTSMSPERDPLQEVAAESLAERFAASDPAAVDHARALVRGVVRYRGYHVPLDQRTELIQNVLTRVARALSESERPARFDAFVRATAHERCVEWLRRLEAPSSKHPSLPDQVDSPHDSMSLEERQRICDAVAELRGPHREVIGLHHGFGLPFAEIAARVARSEDMVRTQMVECIAQVRAFLGKPSRKEGGR
jgi:RNA polymerase sigma factor (sigma-70 family)